MVIGGGRLVLDAAEAKRPVVRLEIHDTPQHGNWRRRQALGYLTPAEYLAALGTPQM